MHRTTVRIIPRLDVKGPNLIKGICLDGWRVLGTPEYFAKIYSAEYADEIIYQDAVASLFQREPLLDVIQRVAAETTIPLTVAGGVRSVDDVRRILRAGADKVAINTAALANPSLLTEASRIFGAQCIVASIEAMRDHNGHYHCFTDYGREPTGVNAFDWARRVVDLGVGEILVTSIDREGTGEGYDVELTARIAEAVPVPVIACGGAGRPEHFAKVVREGLADAVSAASVFHYKYARPVDRMWMQWREPRLRLGEPVDSGNVDFLNQGYGGLREFMVEPTTILDLKAYLKDHGIPVRTAITEPADSE